MSTDVKLIAEQLMEDVWNSRKINVVDDLIDSSYVYHDPNSPEFGLGPDGYKARVMLYVNAFPDLHFSIEDVIAEGDRVLIRWQASGTHEGTLFGIPATGKTVQGPGMNVMRISDGKAVEEWCAWDTLGVLRQIGALPAAALGQAA